MDGYNTSNEEEKMHVNDDTIEQFKEIWMKYDPNGTGLIDVDLFENLVIDLIFEELKMVKKAGK
jgi:Ca2+-binding EF-hand superfamily protein